MIFKPVLKATNGTVIKNGDLKAKWHVSRFPHCERHCAQSASRHPPTPNPSQNEPRGRLPRHCPGAPHPPAHVVREAGTWVLPVRVALADWRPSASQAEATARVTGTSSNYRVRKSASPGYRGAPWSTASGWNRKHTFYYHVTLKWIM